MFEIRRRNYGWSPEQLRAIAENRCKILRVDQSFLETIFDNWQNCGFMHLPVVKWPVGAKVISVHADFAYRGFGIVLCHPDFDMVPDGMMLPYFVEDPTQYFSLRRIDEVFEIPPELKTDEPELVECAACLGTGNYPDIEVCSRCQGTGKTP